MTAGQSFGELALLKNDIGRAASIICINKCSFATLARKDYIWIIGQEQKRKLKNTVEFFRRFRIFNGLRAHIIEKIFQFMKHLKFNRGQHVYAEGHSIVDGVYFITEGEFEITQKAAKSKSKKSGNQIITNNSKLLSSAKQSKP